MTKVCEIYEELCRLAPTGLQMDFDNSGFLLGRAGAEPDAVLLALDVTDEVVDEAIRCGAGLIVSHHPLIFHPLKSVTDESPEGKRLLKLIEHRIAVISMHTNLDIAEGGVNDVLMAALGGRSEGPLDEDGCGRVGVIQRLQFLVLRRESAAGGGVNNQQHLTLVVRERHLLAYIVLHLEIINTLCRKRQHTSHCHEAYNHSFHMFHHYLLLFNRKDTYNFG